MQIMHKSSNLIQKRLKLTNFLRVPPAKIGLFVTFVILRRKARKFLHFIRCDGLRDALK